MYNIRKDLAVIRNNISGYYTNLECLPSVHWIRKKKNFRKKSFLKLNEQNKIKYLVLNPRRKYQIYKKNPGILPNWKLTEH